MMKKNHQVGIVKEIRAKKAVVQWASYPLPSTSPTSSSSATSPRKNPRADPGPHPIYPLTPHPLTSDPAQSTPDPADPSLNNNLTPPLRPYAPIPVLLSQTNLDMSIFRIFLPCLAAIFS